MLSGSRCRNPVVDESLCLTGVDLGVEGGALHLCDFDLSTYRRKIRLDELDL